MAARCLSTKRRLFESIKSDSRPVCSARRTAELDERPGQNGALLNLDSGEKTNSRLSTR